MAVLDGNSVFLRLMDSLILKVHNNGPHAMMCYMLHVEWKILERWWFMIISFLTDHLSFIH